MYVITRDQRVLSAQCSSIHSESCAISIIEVIQKRIRDQRRDKTEIIEYQRQRVNQMNQSENTTAKQPARIRLSGTLQQLTGNSLRHVVINRNTIMYMFSAVRCTLGTSMSIVAKTYVTCETIDLNLVTFFTLRVLIDNDAKVHVCASVFAKFHPQIIHTYAAEVFGRTFSINFASSWHYYLFYELSKRMASNGVRIQTIYRKRNSHYWLDPNERITTSINKIESNYSWNQ